MLDNPALLMVELGNELGEYRPDTTSTAAPTQEWLTDISAFIKSIDKNHLILDPQDETLGKANDFAIENMNVYSAHFYSADYGRLDKDLSLAKQVLKPLIIGEWSSAFKQDWFTAIEGRNIKGSFFWSLQCHENGIARGAKILHNDGFSVYYPEDKNQLLLIANHFQRMRGIKVTTSIGLGNGNYGVTTTKTEKFTTKTNTSIVKHTPVKHHHHYHHSRKQRRQIN